jgi:hypothetical protein
MHQPDEINVLINHIIANNPKVNHHSIPIPCKAKELQKRFLQRMISTPEFMPKPDMRAISHLNISLEKASHPLLMCFQRHTL